MAKAPKKRVRKKRVVRKTKDDGSRLTDKYGRLKFLKSSNYYKDLIQGED